MSGRRADVGVTRALERARPRAQAGFDAALRVELESALAARSRPAHLRVLVAALLAVAVVALIAALLIAAG